MVKIFILLIPVIFSVGFWDALSLNDVDIQTDNDQKSLIDSMSLTSSEKNWLSDHKTIKIAGPRSFPPFHYYEKNGELKGISADYIFMIMDQLGIKIDVMANLPWPEVLNKIRTGEVDLIPLYC
jgi:two-component system, cell cycle sensor histidine kinase and response regulator CckA